MSPPRRWTRSPRCPGCWLASIGRVEAGASELEQITARLEELAAELETDPDEDRAAELVREASELATEASRAIEAVLLSASEPRES